jgi:hypothetical protein
MFYIYALNVEELGLGDFENLKLVITLQEIKKQQAF